MTCDEDYPWMQSQSETTPLEDLLQLPFREETSKVEANHQSDDEETPRASRIKESQPRSKSTRPNYECDITTNIDEPEKSLSTSLNRNQKGKWSFPRKPVRESFSDYLNVEKRGDKAPYLPHSVGTNDLQDAKGEKRITRSDFTALGAAEDTGLIEANLPSRRSPRRWISEDIQQLVSEDGFTSQREIEIQARQTAFELESTTYIVASLLPNSRLQIRYHVQILTTLAGDDSGEFYALPIVVSNGLRQDETYVVESAQQSVMLQNELPPFHGDVPEKERQTTIKLIRHATDLHIPINLTIELIYPFPGAEEGKYLVVIIPRFKPRVGTVREEKIFLTNPAPPLVMKAEPRSKPNDWIIDNSVAGFHSLAKRSHGARGNPTEVDDVCLKFHRWRSVIYDHELDQLVGRTAIRSGSTPKLASNVQIELLRILGSTICCLMNFDVVVGTDSFLLSVDPCGWLSQYMTIDGRPLATMKFEVDTLGMGQCLEDEEGRYVILRQPTMMLGRLVHIEMCWYESPVVQDYLADRGDKQSKEPYWAPLPQVLSHCLLAPKLDCEMFDGKNTS